MFQSKVKNPPVQRPVIQPKLTIGQPGNKYEKEADEVAGQIMRMPETAKPIQRKCENCEEEVQMKPIVNRITPIIQKQSTEEEELIQSKNRKQAQAATSTLENQLYNTKGRGQTLPSDTLNFMNQSFRNDFSDVKIHTGTPAVQMNQGLGAKAFTHGNDIYFNKGEFNPDRGEGKHLLAHELTHVVQQGGRNHQLQRKCDAPEAITYYNTTKSGKAMQWTTGLIEELFKVVGTPDKVLYDNALVSGVIDASFVALVCKAQEILGFTGDDVDGKLGTNTKAAWDKWKTGGKKGIDYNKLLKDKKLEIGLAIGHELHTEFVALETLMVNEGLKLDSSSATKKTYIGKKHFKVQGDNTAAPVEIDIIIECISEKSSGAKATFSEFLTQKEITIYSGHARYGTGPDFDDSKSVAENFVIGVNSALHAAGKVTKGYDKKKNDLLKGKANDLEALSKAGKFDSDLYQVWFMNACSSIHYLDEIRGGLVTDRAGNKKSKDKLRFMGTDKSISIFTDALNILRGILNMETMDEIIAAMNTTEGEDVFFSD